LIPSLVNPKDLLLIELEAVSSVGRYTYYKN